MNELGLTMLFCWMGCYIFGNGADPNFRNTGTPTNNGLTGFWNEFYHKIAMAAWSVGGIHLVFSWASEAKPPDEHANAEGIELKIVHPRIETDFPRESSESKRVDARVNPDRPGSPQNVGMGFSGRQSSKIWREDVSMSSGGALLIPASPRLHSCGSVLLK